MPITKQAEKKLRHDRKRTVQTERVHTALQKLVKSMRKKPTQKSLTQVFAALDKAAKTHVIHKNKAARLKSRLAKLLATK
jgi:small subunit ribosomal protein S20